MKRPTIRVLIAAKAAALKASNPKSRDRIRRELRALEVARQIRIVNKIDRKRAA